MTEIQPSFAEFVELAAEHSVVPVRQELLADHVTPVAVFGRLCGDRPGFLLESVDHGGRWSRWSFVGRQFRARITSSGGGITVDGDLPIEGHPDGILASVEELLAELTSPSIGDLPFHSGLVGFLGYDVVREVEHLPEVPPDDRGWPDAMMGVVGELVALDHWSQRAILIANAFCPAGATEAELRELYDQATASLADMARDGAVPLDEPMVDPPRLGNELTEVELPDFTSTMDSDTFAAAVEVAREHVFAGDIFQVVLSQRFDFDLAADPFDVYRVLRQINPSPYMFFVREPDLSLVGCSPEPMVQLLDDRVISRPIAGTRKRGRTDEHDRKLAAELIEHPKERAEHIMLVDLARNDVGRVVEFGSRSGRRDVHPRALQPRDAPHVAGVGRAGRGSHPDRRAAGDHAGGHRVGGSQGSGHGDHRRPRGHQARPLRRAGRLLGLLGQHRLRHRHSHDGDRR